MYWFSKYRDDEEKRAFAYKQFAINLSIHSLQLANAKHPKSADGNGVLEGIQKIGTGWIQIEERLNNLEGISAQFYTIGIVPLVKMCDWHFGFYIKDQFRLEGGKKLCATVKNLNDILYKLDGIYEKTKNGEKIPAQEVENLNQIHGRIIDDFKNSKSKFHQLLYRSRRKQIDVEIDKISKTRAALNVAFIQTFYQLIGEENANGKTTKQGNNTLRFAYKLFSIGEEVKKLLGTNPEEEMHWAYQQFAANLAFYSHRLYLPTESGDGNEIGEKISKIAQNLMQIILGEEVKTINAHLAIGENGEDHKNNPFHTV